ncbi:MAG: ATPase, T2SS/T4P/T4SS family [Thermogutta sp.]|nr:ATPase, T2SS/T4P/T4SS family [Thermogutta sp.]HOP78514.1 ATPase, T2SS/T4P/T4SS family [Thermogutta sp.]HPU07745.1 ATPase, T2SS/T4P/T4SS family [Thermogutta sp.]
MAVKRRVDYTDLLIRKGIISADQLEEAKQLAAQSGMKLPDAIIRLGYASGEEVMQVMAEQHGLEYIDLNRISIPPNVVELVPESVARENVVIPIAEDDGQLRVAVCDPDDFATFDKLRFILNRRIEICLAPREMILEAINRYYGQTSGESQDSVLSEVTDTAIDFTQVETDMGSIQDADETSAPVVRLVHLIISEAVQLRASDIHIEPFEDRVRIRYRIDGYLIERDNAPRRLLGAILSRIKILARMDIAERRRPQDGRIKMNIGEKQLDLRVSVLPSTWGQAVVMRILDKDNIKIGLRQLGFSEEDYQKFRQLIKRPNGIILVTGPTGSGKTTTLYAALNELNTPDRKIITAEDPVEYYLPGINQVEIRHEIGLDFARVIRAMLRQAPNVILVGEMRDLETAQMGIQASLTGHLVFSTLHTNDAPSSITRLIDMGVPAYLVASSVVAIMAQRLVRVVCEQCKQPYQPSDAVLEMAGITPEMAATATFYRGKGCSRCNGTGYRGRMGIFELMIMSPKIREMTFRQAPVADIRRVAIQEGMRTLYMDGLQKVLRGRTTLEELLSVARPEEELR